MTTRASKKAKAHKRGAQWTCLCERLPFPHRRAHQCDDFALELSRLTYDKAEAERQENAAFESNRG